jgi:hypothetical protein
VGARTLSSPSSFLISRRQVGQLPARHESDRIGSIGSDGLESMAGLAVGYEISVRAASFGVDSK